MKLGDKIVILRESIGMTQTDLAKAIGRSQNTVYKIENGITKNSGHIPAIARVLGVSTEELMSDSQPPEPQLSPEKAKLIQRIIDVEDQFLDLIEEAVDAVSMVSAVRKKVRNAQDVPAITSTTS